MVNSVPKSGQPMFQYLTKIWTNDGPVLGHKYKHNKTLINKTNRAKLEKIKKQANFLKFLIIIFKKWKISNRCKFYGTEKIKAKKAVDQNLDMLKIALSKKTTIAFLDNLFFENYLLLFLTELFPDDFTLNYFCDFSKW